ncbi:ABC transporter permease [Streptomyces sp. SID8381]|uniref:ABC transporter permease n=1 Tax=unclassified Streptomyces TaxID=2593676 RepID=UPI0003644711|nr:MULTISPECIES: ABC transporter permease [unclassified Streptomyces]MYX27473.1 ABC transporter permease [Streptomyces sp. SID8381]
MTATLLTSPDRTGKEGVRAAHRVRPRAAVGHALAIARRNLVQLRYDPSQLLDATLMPMVFTLIFVYVFGGAIGGNQADYRQYLIPGILVQVASFAAQVTGVALNLDFSTGVMDRFRSLPIARSAVLSGRILADLCRLALGQAVILFFALAIGFRIHTNPLYVLGALVLLMLYGLSLAWIAAFVGLAIRSPQAVQSMGFLWMIPLQFGSSMFANPETMPGWLQAFAQVNPTTLVVDSCRGLLVGGPVAGDLLGALAWTCGILVVFAPLAVRRYTRRA